MAIESVALVGVLVAVPLPFWRLAVAAPVRARRRDQLLLLAALGSYVATLAAVAVGAPWLLWPAVAVALALVALAWWRARPDHGRGARIPPGSIRLHPLDLFVDDGYLAREAARHGRIFKIGATFPIPTLTPIVCVVGHDLGMELLREHEGSLEVYPPFPTSRFIPRGFLRNMSREDHDRFAPVIRQAVTSGIDAAYEAEATATARAILARMARDTASSHGRGVDPTPYLRAFAFDVLARLHFGFVSDSEDQRWLAERLRALDVRSIVRWQPQTTRRRRWAETVDELAELDDRRRRGPASVTRSVLGHATAALGDAPDGVATVVGNVLQMQESGTEDLTGLLTWVVKHLGDHPIWQDRLRDDAIEGGNSRSLGERIIRESLRLEQSEFLVRRATDDIDFRGFRIPRGWRLRICIREGHRSPDVFAHPTVFDPDRFLLAALPTTEYAPFGLYRHHCLAARLTHRVGAILVEELARGYRMSISADGPREHGRFHWRPSPRLRVLVEPR